MDMKFNPSASKALQERSFELFQHEGLWCCVQRMNIQNLNGYVSVPESHPFYGKNYSDNVVVENVNELEFNGNYIGLLCRSGSDLPDNVIGIDLAINVHGGITYANDHLCGISEGLFGKVWWFGFDTSHAGDARVIEYFNPIEEDVYRDFAYVKGETIKMAEQLAQYGKP